MCVSICVSVRVLCECVRECYVSVSVCECVYVSVTVCVSVCECVYVTKCMRVCVSVCMCDYVYVLGNMLAQNFLCFTIGLMQFLKIMKHRQGNLHVWILLK